MLLPYLLAALYAFSEHPIPPSTEIAGSVEINEILCESPRFAMDFAAAMSKGDAAELAKDAVGREAHREVCGRFIGLAVPGEPIVATSEGVVYQLIAYRFKEDNRIGWLAQTSFALRPGDNEKPL